MITDIFYFLKVMQIHIKFILNRIHSVLKF